MSIIYLTLDQAIEIHRKTIDISGGGIHGQLELEKLDSVLTHIKNDDYYPTLIVVITTYIGIVIIMTFIAVL